MDPAFDQMKARLQLIVFLLACVLSVNTFAQQDVTELNERASRILELLPGQWSFTLGKNTSGTRHIEVLYPALVLKWSETFDGREVLGDGFLGWDATQQMFFSMAVHNIAGEHGHMKGALSESEDLISWTPIVPKPGRQPFRSEFRLVDQDHFTSTALMLNEHGEWVATWTASFRRIE